VIGELPQRVSVEPAIPVGEEAAIVAQVLHPGPVHAQQRSNCRSIKCLGSLRDAPRRQPLSRNGNRLVGHRDPGMSDHERLGVDGQGARAIVGPGGQRVLHGAHQGSLVDIAVSAVS